MKKKIVLALLILLIIVSALLIYMYWSTQPLDEDKRNLSTSDVQMIVTVKDTANRTPIVRTYTKEEFDRLDEKGMKDVRETVNGKREGDVPALEILKGKGKMEFSFVTSNPEAGDDVHQPFVPKETPTIKISVLETLYSDEIPKEINDSLNESEGGIYFYEVERYLNTEKVLVDEDKEVYQESMYIEVHYQHDNESYVSVFAINTLADE